MRGNEKVIAALNAALKEELTAINQYFVHAEMCESWGYEKLGKFIKKQSIDEMKHADKLIKRVLFLDGLPNLQDLHKLAIGENISEVLRSDLALEMRGRETLVAGVLQCEAARDFVSREMLTSILEDTEEHIDFLETQVSLLGSLGEQNYLQSAMGEFEG